MQTIYRIAKTELRTLFFSPIAWFLLIVFLVQCGIVYFSSMSSIAVQQEIGGWGLKYLNNLTERTFLSPSALFGTVMQNLYLYIPLLTMSLISRETGSGTIKLLYSSPIDVHQIVLGKFLAMMIYSLLLVLVVTVFLISGSFHLIHPEKGMLMTALLGFYLLLCAYASIGLFMSCLTTYQVVAAICTFVMIGVLSYIGNLWQDVELVRELTYFLSINGRTGKMLGGLLTSKDVIYFLLIVGIFLGFSIVKLKSTMESKPAYVNAARYLTIFAVALVIGYFSAQPGLVRYYDATVNKKRTLTPKVQGILAKMKDAPLEVTAYNNLVGNYFFLGSPTSYNDNLARWESYMRFKPDIELRTILYYDTSFESPGMMNGYPGKSLKDIAAQIVKSNDLKFSLFKTPDQIRKIIDLKPELNRYVMLLKWKGRQTYLRVYDDQSVWPSETEVAAALNRLLDARLPKIYFLTGDLERDINKSGDREYKSLTTLKTFRYSLLNQGFDVDTVSLEARDIPSDASILVIADPKLEMGATTADKVRQYINTGGNLIIAGEPGKQSILNPLLSQLGVQMMQGTILQESKEYAPDLVLPIVTPFAGKFTKNLSQTLEDSGKVSMPSVCGLSYSQNGAFDIQPLLVTNAKATWNRIKPLDPDVLSANASSNEFSMGGGADMAVLSMSSTTDERATKRALAGTVSFSPKDGDTRGPLVTAVSLTRKLGSREQRIIVAGDADFLSNKELGRYVGDEQAVNFSFNTALFSWLSYGNYPVDATRPQGKDKRTTLSTDDVSYLKIIYIWVLPALLIILGAVILVRRKRK